MTAITSRNACPVCDSDLTSSDAECPKCHTQLGLFAPTSEIALDFYNDGLDLAGSGDRQGAIEKMRGAIASDSNLVDAYIVLGKLLAQSGETTDLAQAITFWERARGLRPTGEQARKLDHCIETADRSIRAAEDEAVARRRGLSGVAIVGVLLLAAACGVAGYSLRAPRTVRALVPANPAAATGQTGSAANPNSVAPPANPAAAISGALHRPDIAVAREGDKFALHGTVQSEGEKAATLAAAAAAARTSAGHIDGSGLTVKEAVTPVPARRVEHMLKVFVEGLGRGSADPLVNANLSISGGVDKEPLKVTGTCTSPKAGDEVARLVKEIYPSANPVDASGLTFHPEIVRFAATHPHTDGIAHSAVKRPRVPAVRSSGVSARRVAKNISWHRRSTGDEVYIDVSDKTYTVQPGDTIYAITRKYGEGAPQWHKLWQANRQSIHNPNSIPAGTILRLPAGWAPPDKTDDDN